MRIGSSFLFMMALLASPAAAQDDSMLWQHLTLDDTEVTPAPSAIVSQPHVTRDQDRQTPMEIALRGNDVQSFAPQDAIGNGSFRAVETGLVHGNSGLRCPVNHVLKHSESGETLLRLNLFRVSMYNSGGTDISCAFVNQEQTMLVTLFVSQWPDTGLADHFNWAAKTMVERETPLATQISVPVLAPSEAAQANLPEKTMAFAYDGQADGDGVIRREGLWLNKTRGWHVKLRASHMPPAQNPHILAMLIHASALEDVALDNGGLSNQLVIYGPDEAFGLSRNVSWSN